MSTPASSMAYQLHLIGRGEVAEGTMACRFEKPANFGFKAGQYVRMTESNPPETDAEGSTRNFSIASAPYEDTLMITTRMRDTAFKRSLKAMPEGGQVLVQGPFGNLVLRDEEPRPALLLAGGIGITPFRSMVLDAAKRGLPRRIFLFYSNHRPEDAAFLPELQSLEHENPHYRFVPTMTDLEKSRQPWQGETRRLNPQMLSEYLQGVASPLYASAWYG